MTDATNETLDHAGKQQVIEQLRQHLESEAAAMRDSVAAEHRAAEIDQDDTFAVDDLSQSDEAGDLAGLYQRSTVSADRRVDALDGVDFAPTETVGPGAVIGFGGQRYVVGVVATPFTCDGRTYEGISADAPVAQSIAGLRAGDELQLGDEQHRLDFVV